MVALVIRSVDVLKSEQVVDVVSSSCRLLLCCVWHWPPLQHYTQRNDYTAHLTEKEKLRLWKDPPNYGRFVYMDSILWKTRMPVIEPVAAMAIRQMDRRCFCGKKEKEVNERECRAKGVQLWGTDTARQKQTHGAVRRFVDCVSRQTPSQQ